MPRFSSTEPSLATNLLRVFDGAGTTTIPRHEKAYHIVQLSDDVDPDQEGNSIS